MALPELDVAPADARPPQHAFTGVFRDPALEDEFRRDYFTTAIKATAKVVYLIGVTILLTYAALDYLIVPSSHPWPVILRAGVLMPVMLTAWLATRSPRYYRWHDEIAVAVLLIVAAAVEFIGLVGGTPGRELYLAAVTAFAFLCPMGRVSVRGTVVYATVALAGQVLVGVLLSLPTATYLFVVSNTLGMAAMSLLGVRIVDGGARQSFLLRRTIEKERQRSDQLLLNILPPSIAARLRHSPSAIAEGFADVSVLFADLVGFTRLSAKLSPAELVAHLNALFTEFDALADRHGVEKIKTIGDAYMVAAGVPTAQPDGPARIANVALDMLAAVDRLRATGGIAIDVRIGIHTGAVVAGVIGTRKFAYDLWGETVNTAARMESHGLPGKIQVSDATRGRIADEFVVESRGEVDVKGIGAMTTYLLVKKRESTLA